MENDYINPVAERKAILLGGGFAIMLAIIILLSVMLIIKCNDGKWDYNDPKAVIKKERISETDTSEIWRNAIYELVSVSYDTVPKVRRERSTIEPEILAPKSSDCDEWAKYLEKIVIY